MAAFLQKIGDVLAYIIGGTPSFEGATEITFAQSWVGKIATAITGDSTGAIIVPFVLAFTLFGIHMFKSLSGR